MSHDPFEILGVRPDASREEIRSAYRDLAKVWHPDRFSGESPRLRTMAGEKLKDINAAYQQAMGGGFAGRSGRQGGQPAGKFRRDGSGPGSPLFLVPLIVFMLAGVRAGVLFRSFWPTLIALALIVAAAALTSRWLRAVLPPGRR